MTAKKPAVSPRKTFAVRLAELREALSAKPTPESWRRVCRLVTEALSAPMSTTPGPGGAHVPEQNPAPSYLQMDAKTLALQERDKRAAPLAALLREHAPTWPRELARGIPSTWPDAVRKALKPVRETDVYNLFVLGVCNHPDLRLPDGRQAVHLERRYTGGGLTASGARVRVGQRGVEDLSGGVSLVLPSGALLDVRLALEVKSAAGGVSPEQERRLAAVRRRGGVAVVARTVEEAVAGVVAERDRILRELAALGRSANVGSSRPGA